MTRLRFTNTADHGLTLGAGGFVLPAGSAVTVLLREDEKGEPFAVGQAPGFLRDAEHWHKQGQLRAEDEDALRAAERGEPTKEDEDEDSADGDEPGNV